MPVPGGSLIADMLFRSEVPFAGAKEADDQEYGADKHMKTMEAGGQEEGRRIDAIGQFESGFDIFKKLECEKDDAEDKRYGRPFYQLVPVIFDSGSIDGQPVWL